MMQIDGRGLRYSPFDGASSRKRTRNEVEAANDISSKRMRSSSAFSTPPPAAARTSSSASPAASNRKRAREDDDDGLSSRGEDTPREGVRSGLWSWISSPFRARPAPPPPPPPRASSPPVVSASPPPIVHRLPRQRRKHEPDVLGPSHAGPSYMATPYAPLPPPPKKLTRKERHELARDRARRQWENRRAVSRDWADTSVVGRNPAFFLDFDEFVGSEARGPVFDSEVKILKKYKRDTRPRVAEAPPGPGNLQMPFTGFAEATRNGFTFTAPAASTTPSPQPPPAAPPLRRRNAFRPEVERSDPGDSEESDDDDEL
ncbi:hypothetical protein BDZ89DRAFT_509396 [Hymenopellis radicata]|nr:hypothetical protein BDZ89DRAFT_509396 [Hymenopellis radicata]